MNKTLLNAALAGSLLFSATANAEIFWQDISATYLNGSNYEVGDSGVFQDS